MDISNSNSYSIVSGSGGSDSIYNSGSYSTINADAGNDVIDNVADSVMIYGADGNDYLKTSRFTRYVTINGGTGNDTIEPGIGAKGHVIVYLSDDGDDVIIGYCGQEIQLEEGMDYVAMTSDNDVLVSMASGSMRLNNAVGYSLKITGGIDKGSNYFYNNSSMSFVSGTDGNDYISNHGSYVIIFGGNGNDIIYNYDYDVSLNGGPGNDTLIGSDANTDVFIFGSNDGKDLITNYSKNDCIFITDGSSYDTMLSGTNLIVNVGNTSITLEGAYDQILNISNYISNGDGTSERDYITNHASYATVNADAGNDTIKNFGGYSVINGGAGNDSIYNGMYGTSSGDYSTLNGGAGNDTIISSQTIADIYGDTGNDYLSDRYGYALFNGGKGNDTIIGLYENIFEYNMGDGNDLITNYDESSILRITDGSDYTTMRSNSDVIVKVGDGSITFENAYGKTININNLVRLNNNTRKGTLNGTSKGDSINNSSNGEYATINGADGNDNIENYAQYAVLNGDNGNDTIYSYGAYTTINGGKGNDSIDNEGNANVIQYANGDGNDVITNYQTDTTIQITDASNYSATT